MADVANITFKADTSQVKTAATDLDKLAKSGEGVTKAADQVPAKIGAAGKAFDSIKKNATGLSFQLQDVAVQAQMGTNNLTILAQQGPQIASLFGPVGAITGVVIGLGAALAGPMLTALGSVGDESESVADRISQLVKELGDLENAARDVKLFAITDQLFSTSEELDAATKKLAEMKSSLEEFNSGDNIISDEAWKKRTKAIQDQQLVVDLLATKYDRYNSEADRTVKGLNAEKPARDKNTRSITQQVAASEKLLETLKRSNDTFGMSRAEIIRYNAAVAASEAPSEALGLSILAEAEALAEKTENLEQATIAQKAMDKAAAESERVADKMQREYERAFESMSDRITDVIMDFKSMGSVATSIAKQIARSFLQNQIVNPILGGLGFAGSPVSAASSGLNLLSSGGSLLNIGGGLATVAQGLSFFTAGGASAQQAAMLAAQTGGDAAFGSLTMESLGASGGAGGFASMIPSAGLAAIGGLILSDLLEGSKPSLTFGQGAAGAESIPFTVTQSDKGWGVAGDMATYEQISRDYNETLAKYVDTAFGRFGVLDNSFSKKVDQSLADSLLQYVSGLDEIIAGMMSEADIQSVSLTSRFVPEDVYAGMFDKPGTTPVDQLVNRYTQILEGVFPESLTSALMGGENPLDSLASGINAVNIASTFLDKSLTDIGLIFEANAREGETLADTLGRVVTNVSAAQNEFMSFAYETLGAISNLSGLSESIRDRLLTDEQLYGKLETQAESIAQTIETMTDPQSITAAINQINAIVNRQAGLLDDTQFAAMGEEMAVFLDNVEAAALARTQELVDAKNAELLSMENLTSSSENIAVAAVTFGDHVSRFGEMVSAMQSLLGTLSTGREIVSVN